MRISRTSRIASMFAMMARKIGITTDNNPVSRFTGITGRSSNLYGKVGSGKRRRRRNRAK